MLRTLILGLIVTFAQVALGQIVITEWMYSGTDGEFIEFTNVGTDSVDMTGWSFDDDSQVLGTVDLSAFGVVASGESVILTDAVADNFATAWGLTNVIIIGGCAANLGRNDQINLYDSSGTLVDQLSYGDESYPGTPRTQYASCSIPASDYGYTVAQTSWVLATIGDAFGSRTSTGGDIASPGRIVGYALSDYDTDGDVDLTDLIVFANCYLSEDYLTDTQCDLTPDEDGIISADADEDSDVDMLDFAVFANCYSGEDNQADPSCGCSSDDTNNVTQITLNGDSITVDGTGVTISGTTATVTTAGTYYISGTLNDGQIAVNSSVAGNVELVLNGVNISNSTSAAVNIISASYVSIVLADQTQNYLSDATTYVYADANDDEPSGCLFSDESMSISGTGALTVYGNYNDAIVSKDELIIYGGTINVTSVDDGIRGKDYLLIQDGNITITASVDALKSDNDEDANLGYITIESGTLDITSGGDGLTAETDVNVAGGNITIVSGGGYTTTISDDLSAKGIKGVVSVVIDGGTFVMNCADDAIHTNGDITINAGTFNIATGDDGVHADANVVINGGTMTITNSYEGLEGANITINNGNIHLTSSDDGVNVAGGNDSSGGWTPGSGTTIAYFLYINGGYLVVNATGDGLDSNGSIQMTGGTVIVNGPTSDGDGPLDYDGTFNISGGVLLAVGSSGMAQTPSTSSTQRSVKITYSATKTAGTLIHLQKTSGGTDVLTFAPAKSYQSCVFSSPNLASGTSYKLYKGGSSTGTVTDGLYSGGTYTAGTLTNTFTTSSIVTSVSAP